MLTKTGPCAKSGSGTLQNLVVLDERSRPSAENIVVAAAGGRRIVHTKGRATMVTNERGQAKIAELVKGMHVAMVTTTSVEGGLRSRPLAPQQVDFDGDVFFIVERHSSVVSDVTASSAVNVAYVDGSTWVSVSGTARVVNDEAKLAELWDTFTDAWLKGGPDDSRNVLLHVSAESAEYWDSPGAKVTQVANLVKAKVTGERIEPDKGKVEL